MTFVRVDGARAEGRIALNAPVIVSDVESRCAVALDGFETRERWIAGNSTLQALLLAMRFAEARIASFRECGGRVLYAESEREFDLARTLTPVELLLDIAMENRAAIEALEAADVELAATDRVASIPMKWRKHIVGVRVRLHTMIEALRTSPLLARRDGESADEATASKKLTP